MIVCDDNIEDHPKFIGLGNDAFALWFRCIGYCRRNLTDGFVPEHAAAGRARVRNPAVPIAELLKTAPGTASPLWHRVDGGYRVHDYLDWNPSRADVEAKLEVNREKGRKGGIKSARLRGASNQAASQGQAGGLDSASTQIQAASLASACAPNSTQSNPDPIRSDPVRSGPEDQDPEREALPAKAPRARSAVKATRAPASDDPAAPAWLAAEGLPALDDPTHGPNIVRMLDWSQTSPKGAKLKWSLVWKRVWRDLDSGPPSSGRRVDDREPELFGYDVANCKPSPEKRQELQARAIADAERMCRGERKEDGSMW